MLGKYPMIAITGPRQSGKTTFCKMLRPGYRYVSLEPLETRAFAREDPRNFLQTYQGGVILDEVQHVPELFPYLQNYTDERGRSGEYILSGSQNFLLLEKITQSLAGRIAIFHLLPFSTEELEQGHLLEDSWEAQLVRGFYPRMYDKDIDPADFFPSYILTYVERDIRQLINVPDAAVFRQFLSLCAGRIGQLVNFQQIGADLGIDQRTVKRWLSILETSFIIRLLGPYHRNFDKRIVKSPKIYFTDTGLASWLLGIRSVTDLKNHFARGSLYENFIMAELLKRRWNRGEMPAFYFWRDSIGNEVDLLIENGLQLDAIEIKAGMTVQPSFFTGLERFQSLSGQLARPWLVYGGEERQNRKQAMLIGWRHLDQIPL